MSTCVPRKKINGNVIPALTPKEGGIRSQNVMSIGQRKRVLAKEYTHTL